MPRFRPFIGEPTTSDYSFSESVKVVNSKRIVQQVKLDDKLPDLAFFDLEKLAKSNDVRLQPMNSTLFPARSITDGPAPEVKETEVKETETTKTSEVKNA